MDARDYERIIKELIELVSEGVYIADENGNCLFCNKNMAAIEGTDTENILGRPFCLAFENAEPDKCILYDALNDHLITKNQGQVYRNRNGEDVSLQKSSVPVLNGERTVAAIEVVKRTDNSEPEAKKSDEKKNATSEKTEKNLSVRKYQFSDIAGNSPGFRAVIDRAEKASENKASVFIYGETGTGKELFAQSIHYGGKRKDRPFIAQNCAAIPENLLEGILFGTSVGGFTGAVDRPGLFEQASGGTLLLDEINSMPIMLQSKLLRVLQEEYIRRIGGKKDIPVDVRIIATVNEPPEKLIREGKLRKDLYYRLNVVNLSIPPLRERKEDIPVLVEKLIEKHSEKFQKDIREISPEALEKLQSYDYPGNVRELENIIMQAVVMADAESVLTEEMIQMPETEENFSDVQVWDGTESLEKYMNNIEKNVIKKAVMMSDGNLSRAAESLKLTKSALQRKLKEYDI